MKIISSPEVKAAHKAAIKAERNELISGGKITIRWLQHSAAFFIYSGRNRPSIQGFTDPDDAIEYLKEKHNIDVGPDCIK